MSTEQSTETRLSRSDPERIRALAHPLRLALLEYLDDTGEATATQCAKHTGESVANCSFHLRLLARYGFIEPAEQRGRERPWRPSARREQFVPDESVPGSVRAVVELAEVAVRQEAEGFIGFLHQRADRAAELTGRSLPASMTKDTFWATPDETDALLHAVGALLEPYVARMKDASSRPAGALLMRWFATSHPDLAVDPAPGPEAPDAPHPLAPHASEEA
ncbi:hypothetical protein ASE38_05510 [Cellulomonas sp. Root930]|nr:hypothetical protein ASE38_05510 [Cellulomonas sp. Root930]